MHPIALVDLDGTLANYHLAMQKALALLEAPGEPPYEDGLEPEWIRARRHLIATQAGFWRNLPPIPLGFEILNMVRRVNFSVTVLTKGPANKPVAWAEKVDWCRNYLPDTPVTITEDKSHTYGSILVDDWPPYVSGWLAHRPRGIVIVPAQPWNVEVEQLSPRIFRYDGSNPDRLLQILRVVYRRAPGEAADLSQFR